MKIKKKLKKYGEGGKTNPPIITNDPKDERLKAYNDSLNLYNDYLKADSSLSTISNVKRVDLGNNIEYSLPYAVNDNTNTRIFYNQLQGNNSRNVLNFNHDYTIAGYGNKGHYTTFSLEKEQKPVQPIIYQSKKLQEKPINLPKKEAELLPTTSGFGNIERIPFKKGTYFTRPRQSQEAGQGLLDYFDKTTGKLLGTYEFGGNINTMIQQYDFGGINRFDQPVQQAQGLQPFQLPYNELATALLSKQKGLEEKQKEVDAYADYINKIQSLPQDAPIKAEIANNINNMISELQDTDLNSPTGIAGKRNLSRYIRQEFGPTGRATDMISKYVQAQNWLKRAQDNKEIDKGYLNHAYNAYLSKYSGQGKLNPVTGGYNPLVLPDLVDTPNITEYFDKYGKDIESTINQKAYAAPDGKGYLYEGTYYSDKRSPELIAKVLGEYAQNDPQLKSYLQQGSEIGLFDPNAINKGLIYNEKVKDKRGNEFDKLQVNPYHPFATSLYGAINKYTKDVYKETKDISADSEYGRKREEDLKFPDFTGWSQGLEGKPITTGGTPKETETLIKSYDDKLNKLNSDFQKLITGKVVINKDLEEIKNGNYKYFQSLNDDDLAYRGLSREIVNKFVNEQGSLQEAKNLAETKNTEAEQYAKSKLGNDYTNLKQKYDLLPEIKGHSKEEIIDAIKNSPKPGVPNSNNKNRTIALGDFWNQPKEIQDKYTNYINDKTNIKFLKLKEDYYKQPGKKQSTQDIEYGWNIGGYESKDLRTVRNAAEQYFSNPLAWAQHKIISNDPELNGNNLANYFQQKGIDFNDKEKFEVDGKNVALSKNVLDPSVEDLNKLAFRVPIYVDGKAKEIWITTDQVQTPEIQQLMNSPTATAYKNYSSARREGVDTYKPLRYSDQNVKFNFTDKYKPISIYGINYDETTGLKKLAAIERALNLGLDSEQIKKALKDVE